MNEELANFYQNDKKEYVVSKNKEFLKWLGKEINNGYHTLIDLEGIQNLIDFIVKWYEIKYPNKCLRENKLSRIMNYNEFMNRISDKSSLLMKCDYLGYNHRSRCIYDKDGNIDYKIDICFLIETEYVNYSICADSSTGIIYEEDVDCLKEFTDINFVNNVITIEDLLKELNNKKIKCPKLAETINNHKVDLELRKKILELAALNILYSKTTTPKQGYDRALLFIDEFNRYISNLNLNFEKLDTIMYLSNLKGMVKIARKI